MAAKEAAMSTTPAQHPASSNVTTLVAATANVLNLANPGRMFYANQDVYSQRDFERKIDCLRYQDDRAGEPGHRIGTQAACVDHRPPVPHWQQLA